MMKNVHRILEMDKYECGLIMNALYNMRTKLLCENKETIAVDEILLKISKAPKKKKLFSRGCVKVLDERG